MTSTKQKLGGLFIALIGAWGTYFMWSTAIHDGRLYEMSVPFPAFAVLGVAVIFLRPYKEERLARGEDISNLPAWKLFTPAWRVVFIVALVVAFANYFLIRTSFNWSE
jgi:hypothetical protein